MLLFQIMAKIKTRTVKAKDIAKTVNNPQIGITCSTGCIGCAWVTDETGSHPVCSPGPLCKVNAQ